jgi:hypothetical protein
MPRKNNELEELKLFVAHLLNEEQDSHSKLLSDIKEKAGNIKSSQELIEVLTKIYEGKVDTLNKIFKKIQEVE